jgi:hypothetical protein
VNIRSQESYLDNNKTMVRVHIMEGPQEGATSQSCSICQLAALLACYLRVLLAIGSSGWQVQMVAHPE